MRFVFLADASPSIGAGHVMRSSAIAEEAISRGIKCIFVGSILKLDWLVDRIRGLGFSEIMEPHEFRSSADSDVLVLDSYTTALDNTFLEKRYWSKIVAIADDSTPEYLADLVIHPGLDGNWYHGDPRKFLYGAKFIPLRKSIKRSAIGVKDSVSKIVIFGGGTDEFNFSLAIAAVLKDIGGFKNATFFSKEKINIEKLDRRFNVQEFGLMLDTELLDAELVLTTASTSSLEVISCGIPVGVACSVANQSHYYSELGNLGVASTIGERVTTGSWNLDSKKISTLINDQRLRSALIKKGAGEIDFEGGKRIVDAILKLATDHEPRD
jgi:spore coat polysaccharide biosynthesis predicted glycosyltransferase SpsG